jgi:hypothetical protein
MASQTIPMCGVTVLPMQPPRPGLGFDEFQFQKRAPAVSAKSEIAFEDYTRMRAFSIKGRRRREYIPAFAWNNRKFCKVLAVGAFRYCHGGRVPFPEGISLAELRQWSDAKFNEWSSRRLENLPAVEREMIRRHVSSVERAGGYLHLHATVAYLSWRLGYASPAVAEQLCLAAPGVRMILYRLTAVARSLGYETFKPGKWMAGSKVRQRHITKLPPGPDLLRLHESKAYWTCRRLAKKFKVKTSTVQNAIYNAKKRKRLCS